MAIHSSILGLEDPMDRGAWWAAIQRGHKESDMAEQLTLSLSLGYYEKCGH